MSKRLHPVEGPLGPVVARGWAADPDTLDGLTGPVDPAFLLALPRAMTPQDFALAVAAVALLTLGRTEIRTAALARVCGLGPKSLPTAVARLAKWAPSLGIRLDGESVTLATSVKRRLRPDLYVRLKVQTLAKAPSAAHARFYVLAAQATVGDEGVGRNRATLELADLGLGRGVDSRAAVAELLAWAQPLFGDGRRGKLLSAAVVDGSLEVQAVNSCHWNYNHESAPRPWIGKGKGKDSRITILDGAWRGVELSVSWLRVAKVCEWAARNGCRTPAHDFVAGWLVALRRAIAGEDCDGALSGSRLLDAVQRLGAARAFETFVLDAAARAVRHDGWVDWPWATAAARAAADDARVLRRMAMSNPADPRLKVHARCGDTGEEFTSMQFARLVRRTMAHLRTGGASRDEISATWKRLHRNYRGGPRAVQRVAQRPPFDREAVGAALMLAQCEAPAHERVAHEVALVVALSAASMRGLPAAEAVDCAIAAQRWGDGAPPQTVNCPETARWAGLRREWTRASATAGRRPLPLEAMVRDLVLAAVAEGAGIRQAA